MIFMSQSGLTDRGRDADWDRWYLEHLRIMVSVKGVESAQRFKTTTPEYSPSLAMYSMESAAVFADPYYLRIRGLGEFSDLVDRRYYRRNLFSGLDLAPAVTLEQALLVWDAPAPRELHGFEFAWLEAVAVDKSTPFRGIAVIDARRVDTIPKASGIACYIPASGVFHK
jgi:hypothetical protein